MDKMTIGFLPLVDAALPILARECGFAEEEGLDLTLIRDMSWASVLDRLLYAHSDCAHMLAPLAIATTLGRNRPPRALSVPFILGLNGNAITTTNKLAEQLLDGEGLGDPAAVGARLKALIAARDPAAPKMRFGVVHRYSSHNYKLRYWLASCGIRPDEDVEIVTIAPPFAADALAQGEVDAICVGEPWNSVAVDRGVGRIILVTAQIWRRGVEKVLATPEPFLEDNQELFARLIRALHRAARHFVDPETWDASTGILARTEYLDGSPALIRNAISDHMLLRQGAEPVHIPDFMFQYREAANFPWKSQARWLFSQLVRWDRLDWNEADLAKVDKIFRPGIYRAALANIDTPMPGANSKLEGGVEGPLPVGSTKGRLTLGSDPFFDNRIFDPDKFSEYIQQLP